MGYGYLLLVYNWRFAAGRERKIFVMRCWWRSWMLYCCLDKLSGRIWRGYPKWCWLVELWVYFFCLWGLALPPLSCGVRFVVGRHKGVFEREGAPLCRPTVDGDCLDKLLRRDISVCFWLLVCCIECRMLWGCTFWPAWSACYHRTCEGFVNRKELCDYVGEGGGWRLFSVLVVVFGECMNHTILERGSVLWDCYLFFLCDSYSDHLIADLTRPFHNFVLVIRNLSHSAVLVWFSSSVSPVRFQDIEVVAPLVGSVLE